MVKISGNELSTSDGWTCFNFHLSSDICLTSHCPLLWGKCFTTQTNKGCGNSWYLQSRSRGAPVEGPSRREWPSLGKFGWNGSVGAPRSSAQACRSCHSLQISGKRWKEKMYKWKQRILNGADNVAAAQLNPATFHTDGPRQKTKSSSGVEQCRGAEWVQKIEGTDSWWPDRAHLASLAPSKTTWTAPQLFHRRKNGENRRRPRLDRAGLIAVITQRARVQLWCREHLSKGERGS